MFKCKTGCCKIKINNYVNQNKKFNNKHKAGIFIYDPTDRKVLLVQSRGKLWGPPKGTVNIGESYVDCAIREVYEETGIKLNRCQSRCSLLKIPSPHFLKIKDSCVYYYIELKFRELYIQNTKDNDANGITWIKISCLEELINDGLIILTHHAKIAFNYFINIKFNPNQV